MFTIVHLAILMDKINKEIAKSKNMRNWIQYEYWIKQQSKFIKSYKIYLELQKNQANTTEKTT